MVWLENLQVLIAAIDKLALARNPEDRALLGADSISSAAET